MSNKNYSLIIGWLYPDLMSTYGDRGNIIAVTKRCEWRGIDIVVKRILLDTPLQELRSCDLLFMGGAQDRQQKIVADDLRKKSRVISDMVEMGIPGLYICGAFQFLGKYYKEADETMIEGLSIFDLHTINPGFNVKRLIGNVVIETDMKYLFNPEFSKYLVGFENHGGRTYLGKGVKSLGKVARGFGNNGEDGTEGAVYKNSFGSYFHGPILPKNPHFADHLITKALEVKYKEKVQLNPLDDALEKQTHIFIAKRLGVKI
jgi:CobQ-like glutamine amidotransferase family enzyme